MKNGGGHFAPELGGHFELESGGHFKLELGGQYHWNLQKFLNMELDFDEFVATKDVVGREVGRPRHSVDLKRGLIFPL